jgi:hypothetical protein
MYDVGFPVVPAKFCGSVGEEGEPPVFVFARINATGIKSRVTKQVKRNV